MNVRLLAASVCLSLCGLLPALAGAQALTSLASVRVGYTTRKNTVKPQGELKAQIDALDAQIAEATRLGKNRRAAPAVREGHRAAERRRRGPTRSSTRARSCCGHRASSSIRRSRTRCGWNRFTRRRWRCRTRVTAHVTLRKRSRRRPRQASSRRSRRSGQGPRHVRRRRRAICASRRSSSTSICTTSPTARTC